MNNFKVNVLAHIQTAMVNHRWVFILGLGVISVMVDPIEPEIRSGKVSFNFIGLSPIELLIDILIHGVLFCFLIGILISWLDRSEKEHGLSEEKLTLQKTLSFQLEKTNDWKELTELIIDFPRIVLPYIGALLWVYSKDSKRFLLEAGWGYTGPCQANSPECFFNHFGEEPVDARKSSRVINTCRCIKYSAQKDNPDLQMYCIHFIYNDETVGILSCYFPNNFMITDFHRAQITNISPIIAVALVEGKRRDPAFQKAIAVQEVKSQISQNLHDVIAADLAYLRYELELFSEADYRELASLFTVHEELQKMRGIAAEAYDEVRNTLESLAREGNEEFGSSLSNFIGQIANRTGLEIKFVAIEPPINLPPTIQTQIFSIIREALTNVNLHAKAQHVEITFQGFESYASLVISDDGQGYNPQQVLPEGHRGLKIMQERARKINGNLEITSTPGEGARIQLHFPYTLDAPAKSPSFHWINYLHEANLPAYENTPR